MPKKNDPAHRKDLQYEAVGLLINRGTITNFADIFKVTTLSAVAIDLKKGNKKMAELIANPSLFTIGDIHRMAELFNCNWKKMLDLVTKEIVKK